MKFVIFIFLSFLSTFSFGVSYLEEIEKIKALIPENSSTINWEDSGVQSAINQLTRYNSDITNAFYDIEKTERVTFLSKIVSILGEELAYVFSHNKIIKNSSEKSEEVSSFFKRYNWNYLNEIERVETDRLLKQKKYPTKNEWIYFSYLFSLYPFFEAIKSPITPNVRIEEYLKNSSDLVTDYKIEFINGKLTTIETEPGKSVTYGLSFQDGLCSFCELDAPEKEKAKALFIAVIDAPYALILYRKSIPQALISFDFVLEDKSIIVKQIQGIRGYKDRNVNNHEESNFTKANLFNISWDQLLIDQLTAKVSKLNINKIVIQSAINNPWPRIIYPHNNLPHMTFEAAERRYDQFAMTNGFHLDTLSGNFIKNVKISNSTCTDFFK